MTDEISIQQQQGNYAGPSAIGGALAGGATGVGLAYWKNWGFTSEADYKKHLEQQPDSFTSQINHSTGTTKTYFEAVKEETQKLANLKDEHEKKITEAMAEKTETVSKPIPDEMNTRKTNITNQYNTRLQELVAQEERRLGSSTSIAGIDVRNPKFPAIGFIADEKFMPEGTSVWNPLAQYQAHGDYNRLTNAVTTASNAVTARLNVAGQPLNLRANAMHLTPAPRTTILSIPDLFESFVADYNATTTDAERATLFDKTQVRGGATVTSNAYNKAYALAESFHTAPATISNPNTQFEHYLKFGTYTEGTRPVAPLGGRVEPMSYLDPKTGYHSGWITYTDAAKTQYEQQLRTSIEAQRAATAEQFLAQARTYVDLKKRVNPTELITTIKQQFTAPEYFEGLGRTSSAEMYSRTDWINVNEILNESRKNTYEIDTGTKKFGGYANDIYRLEEVVNSRGTSMPTVLNGEYYDAAGNRVTDPVKALDIARKRQSIAEAYTNLESDLNKQIKECMENNQYIRELDDKIVKAYAEDKGINEALSNLSSRFKKIFPASEVNGDVKAQAEAAAKELIQKETIGQQYKAVNDEVAEFTRNNTETKTISLTREQALEKVGSLEKFTTEAKESALKRLEPLAKEAKVGNKTLTGLFGAAILGLVCGLIGMSIKKDQA